jgi:O-antigen/teichoic acid export membrane protein
MIVKTIQSNLMIQLFTFASSVMIARVLGPTGRGELAIVLLYPQLIANIALFGVDRAIPIMAGRNELANPINMIVKLVILLALPAIAGAWILIEWQISDTRLIHLSRLYLLYIPALQFFVIVVAMFNGVGDFDRFNRARIVFYLLNAIFVAAIWVSFPLPVQTLELIIFVHLAAGFGAFLYCVWLLRGFKLRAQPTSYAPVGIGAVLSLAVMFAFPLALAQFNNLAYQILVEHWMGVQALGIFIIFITYTRLLSPIGSAVSSKLFRLGIVGSHEDIARISRLSLIIYVTGIIPLIVLGPLIMPLIFGRDFVFDTAVVSVLFLSTLFCMLADSLAEYLNGQRKVLEDIIGRLSYVIALILLSVFLVPKYGLFAMAISMAGADLVRWMWLAGRSAGLTNQRFTMFFCFGRNDFIELFSEARTRLRIITSST